MEHFDLTRNYKKWHPARQDAIIEATTELLNGGQLSDLINTC